MNTTIMEKWMKAAQERNVMVNIYVHSGVRLTGHILDWDDECILLDTPNGTMPINREFGWSSIKEA